MSYDEARRLVLAAGIRQRDAFKRWKRPVGMPSNPWLRYKQWKSWSDFVGVTYQQARRLADRVRPPAQRETA